MAPAAFLALGVAALVTTIVLVAYGLGLTPVSSGAVRARVLPATALTKERRPARRLSAGRPNLGIRRLWVLPTNIRRLEVNLEAAGKPADALPLVLLLKLVLPIMFGFIGWVLASSMGETLVWLFFWGGLVVSYFYPDIYLSSRAVERRAAMEHSMPDILEQITIALDAGMSFEAAFARVGQTHRGPLGPQIMRTVQDMSVGVPRRDAYLALAERNGIEDLTRLVRSLIQAEEFGVPISSVVRLLAEEMRDKRRQRAEAKAKTIPLKLLFPMMTCLLPVLFIVMLTPSIISLGEVL